MLITKMKENILTKMLIQAFIKIKHKGLQPLII